MLKNEMLKTVFRYSIPTMVSMWIFTLYTMIDGVFISRYVGTVALAGVNLTLPLINLIFSISIMIGVGSSTLVSIKFGQGKIDEGNKILTLGSLVNLICGILLSGIIILNIDRVVILLGANEQVYNYLKEYTLVIISFSVFYMLGYAFEIYIKVDGKPTYPALSVLIGGIMNLALDYLFVVVYPFGIKGAAYATGISQVTTCSILFYYILFKSNKIKFVKLKKIQLSKVYQIFKTGFSEFLTEISSGIILYIFNIIIIKRIGTYGVSIFGIISYISSFIIMTMIGFAQGIQPVISYNVGQKNHKNIVQIFRISLSFLIGLGLLFYILTNYFSYELFSIFLKNSKNIVDSERVFILYSVSYIIVGINLFISAYFTAIKKIWYSSIITLFRGVLLNGIFLLVLPNIIGEDGIWLSPFFSEFVTIFISIYLVFKLRKVNYFEI